MNKRKKIFFLVSRVPYPLEKGDKLRAYFQLRELATDFDITLCALNDTSLHPDALPELKKYCQHITIIQISKWAILMNLFRSLFFSRLPLQVNYFYYPFAAEQIKKLIENDKPDFIFCQLLRMAEYVKDIALPKTLDYMDALSQGMERRIEKSPFYLKPFVRLEARRLKIYEHLIFSFFEHKIIISAQDRHHIVHCNNQQIRIVPNGVDEDRYKPIPEAKKIYDVMFSGNMSYPPNIDAALFLLTQIMPLVWQKRPQAKVLIAGTNPTHEIKKMASNRVIVSGWVDDMNLSYNSAKLFVAPMQLGSGLQNKLLEAMAAGLPCITSRLANNALGAIPGKEISIAQTAQEFAENIVYALENEQLCRMLAQEAAKLIRTKYSWQAATKDLKGIFA